MSQVEDLAVRPGRRWRSLASYGSQVEDLEVKLGHRWRSLASYKLVVAASEWQYGMIDYPSAEGNLLLVEPVGKAELDILVCIVWATFEICFVCCT